MIPLANQKSSNRTDDGRPRASIASERDTELQRKANLVEAALLACALLVLLSLAAIIFLAWLFLTWALLPAIASLHPPSILRALVR